MLAVDAVEECLKGWKIHVLLKQDQANNRCFAVQAQPSASL